jgi:serine/threonine protein kinase
MVEPETIVDGRYRIDSRIGTGGMADVYLAEDLQLGRQVAVKILHRRFAEDQEFVERFRREASAAAGLSHPNVVSVFDRGQWDGTYYIAMEYLPGRSLKTIVREQGALEPAVAIDIVIQILRAARFAHQRGVIHRDLKPHNVIVDDEGRARVTDFGIARAGASDMTQTGSIMGTAQYLSPEQAQGHAVSAASDLYAVGIVLYELLTGSLPFDGETAVTIALKQVAEAPRPPSALNPAVTPALDAVVLCALAKDPANRFADAAQFIAALQDARLTLEAQGSPTAQFGAVSAPMPFVLPAPVLSPLPPSNGPLAPPRKPRRWGWLAVLAVLVLAGAAVALIALLHKDKVMVPTLAHCESQEAASTQLSSAGLTPQAVSQTSTVCETNQVVSQSPAGGTVVRKGSAVTIIVSSGSPAGSVPLIVDDKHRAATDELENAGFKPIVAYQHSTTVKPGFVISTNPPGGTLATLSTGVVVTISTGPKTASVPSVTGLSEDDAATQLQSAGFKLGKVTKQAAAGQTAGTVLSQSPAAGGTLPVGRSIKLVIAKLPTKVVVPKVVGQNEVQAGQTLGAAGFGVGVDQRAVTNPAKVGVVLSQHPAPATKVHRASTVTITIGIPAAASSTTTTTSSTAAPPITSEATTTSTSTAATEPTTATTSSTVVTTSSGVPPAASAPAPGP